MDFLNCIAVEVSTSLPADFRPWFAANRCFCLCGRQLWSASVACVQSGDAEISSATQAPLQVSDKVARRPGSFNLSAAGAVTRWTSEWAVLPSIRLVLQMVLPNLFRLRLNGIAVPMSFCRVTMLQRFQRPLRPAFPLCSTKTRTDPGS